jgi:hypothetical protein
VFLAGFFVERGVFSAVEVFSAVCFLMVCVRVVCGMCGMRCLRRSVFYGVWAGCLWNVRDDVFSTVCCLGGVGVLCGMCGRKFSRRSVF